MKKRIVSEFVIPSLYARIKGVSRQRVHAMIKSKHPKIEIKIIYGKLLIRDKLN